VPQRSLVLYTPIGKMTSTYVFQHHHEYLLENAYKFITYWFDMFQRLFGAKKTVVHAGNIAKHATALYDFFNADGKYKAMLHEKGNLKGTIDSFLADSKSQILLVTASEYGLDLKDILVQFVLKIPYATYDDRARALERKLGKNKFKEWYDWDGVSRVIQGSGRISRGSGDRGCTFLMDSKFFELYKRYRDKMPLWFLDRLVGV